MLIVQPRAAIHLGNGQARSGGRSLPGLQHHGGDACAEREGARIGGGGVAAGGGVSGAVMAEPEKFCYVYSCDLDINVQLKM